MATDRPWHRPALLADPAWFSFNGCDSGSPFATAAPLYGTGQGRGDPGEQFSDARSPALGEALDRLMVEALSEEEAGCLSMSAVAGLPYSAIAEEWGFWLSSGEPDRKKAHRRVASATKKLRRRMMQQADQLVGEVDDRRLTRFLA